MLKIGFKMPKIAFQMPKVSFQMRQDCPKITLKSLKNLWKINVFATGLQLGPKRAQDGPRWSTMAEHGTKMAPRWRQDGPKMAPRCPKMAQGSPKMAPR